MKMDLFLPISRKRIRSINLLLRLTHHTVSSHSVTPTNMTCNCRSSGAAIRLLLLLRLAPRLDHFPQRHILHKLPPIAHCSEYQYITAQHSTAQHSRAEHSGAARLLQRSMRKSQFGDKFGAAF